MEQPDKGLRVAVIATVYRYINHAQHLVDRFLVGFPRDGQWCRPDVRIASLCVDQRPEGDQSEDRAREFGFGLFPTVAEALRLGGTELAVDGVLLIGEHGDYPENEKGQRLYPRHKLFKECIEVFEKDGRAVPVFNDKHLSYSFAKAKEMVEDSARLGFPFMAGSPLTETWRLPELELPLGCEVEGALTVGYGGSEAMDYHLLEALQCMVERRKGGETGVKSVQLIEGDEVWQARDDGRWSGVLLEAALSRSDSPLGLSDEDGRTQDLVETGRLEGLVEKPIAYLIEYRDGLEATHLVLNGALKDFCFAARLKGEPEPLSTQFLLTPLPNVTHSACLIASVLEFFETGAAPYPVERTLLAGGILEAGLDSRVAGCERLVTPHLDVGYSVGA